MRNGTKFRRLLMVACLAASVALAACGGDDNPAGNNANNSANNGADTGEPDTGVPDVDDQDAGDEDSGEHDAGDEDSGEQDAGDEDANAETCEFDDVLGQASDLELDETATSWLLNAEADAQMLSLWIGKDAGAAGTGSVAFADSPLADQDNALVVGRGCSSGSCDAYFMAIGGSMDITTWDKDIAGSFEADISDIELVEIAATANGFERVDSGQSSCIDSLSLTAATDPMDIFPADVTCDRDGITTAGGSSAVPTDGGALIVEAGTDGQATQDFLSLQIYPDLAGAATSAGTYELTDFNYATCENCLLIYAGCDDQTCQKTFIAGEGTLEITNAGTVDGAFTAGEPFTAALTDAKLVEVTIDSNYDTEIVEGGESWCISQYYWDGAIQSPLP